MRECSQTINGLDFIRASGYTSNTYVALKYLRRIAFRLPINMIFGKLSPQTVNFIWQFVVSAWISQRHTQLFARKSGILYYLQIDSTSTVRSNSIEKCENGLVTWTMAELLCGDSVRANVCPVATNRWWVCKMVFRLSCNEYIDFYSTSWKTHNFQNVQQLSFNLSIQITVQTCTHN